MKKNLIIATVVLLVIAGAIYAYKKKAIDDAKKRVYSNASLMTQARNEAMRTNTPIDKVVTRYAEKISK